MARLNGLLFLNIKVDLAKDIMLLIWLGVGYIKSVGSHQFNLQSSLDENYAFQAYATRFVIENDDKLKWWLLYFVESFNFGLSINEKIRNFPLVLLIKYAWKIVISIWRKDSWRNEFALTQNRTTTQNIKMTFICASISKDLLQMSISSLSDILVSR